MPAAFLREFAPQSVFAYARQADAKLVHGVHYVSLALLEYARNHRRVFAQANAVAPGFTTIARLDRIAHAAHHQYVLIKTIVRNPGALDLFLGSCS